MNRDRAAVIDWQRRYAECQQVWTVIVADDETGNLYESREAAELEAQWYRARGHRRVRVRSAGRVHTLALAQERWT